MHYLLKLKSYLIDFLYFEFLLQWFSIFYIKCLFELNVFIRSIFYFAEYFFNLIEAVFTSLLFEL
jgi:hypothetical protein